MQNSRVYIAIETFLPLVGGSEKQALLQSKYLRSQGVEATIITMRFQRAWPVCEQLEGVPVLRVAGHILTWHERLPGVLRHLCYCFALLVMCWQLWKHRHEYEILHVFQLTLFTLPALLVCCLAQKPLVIGMRCDSRQVESGQRNKGMRANSWADLDGLLRLGRSVRGLINHLLRETHAHILILSTQMRESLRCSGLNGASVLLIPNGVDADYFHPSSEPLEQEATVVCVAKLRYQKGIDILLHAWRSVSAQVPAARLLIVGDGPLLASLSHLASELRITGSVEFTGLCADVPRQLQRGRVAVLPSRWEGMPNALLEAMSCGLACVATRVSGSEDLLSQGGCGLLVEPEDVDGLAAALLRLLKDPDLARRYGQAARHSVEQFYLFERIMYKHIALYRSLAK